MCVIVIKPKDADFPDADFKKCWDRNSHGLGFIVLDPFVHKKGIMKEKDALKQTREYRKKGYISVFHFRISSKGGVCSNLTHPFPFHSSDGRERFLFHNGTIHALNPRGEFSDTSQAATWLSVLSDEDCDKLLLSWRGTYGRFVTVIQKPNGTRDLSIYEDRESATRNGLWYSNLRHLDPKDRPTVGDGILAFDY